MGRRIPSTKQKALAVNLKPEIYGSFAEIGAGQEVARYFFMAGGASGTIAQTISAYDMVFSDAIYGKEESGRYVCESRVKKMLAHEYKLLNDRLGHVRGDKTCFFTFANTVAAKAFNRDNESHGWIGVRFQLNPKEEANQIIIHVRMLEATAQEQQKSLGIIGVNLVHASFMYSQNKDDFMSALMDHLTPEQIEIDMIRFEGKTYSSDENHLMNLELVRRGYTNAIMFDKAGHNVLPSDVLYKKNILAVRGSYHPPTLVNLDILKKGEEAFCKDHGLKPDQVITLAEITVNNLTESGEFNPRDFLDRVDLLCALDQWVLISNYPEYYRLSSYFSRFTKNPIGIVLGVFNFKQIFDAEYNKNLEGGILESLGLLFRHHVKVYIYPYRSEKDGVLVTSKNLEVREADQHLYNYLKANSQVSDIANYEAKNLHIYSRMVFNLIKNHDLSWESMVPLRVKQIIYENGLFGVKKV